MSFCLYCLFHGRFRLFFAIELSVFRRRIIKLRMDMGNVSKRQQPDHRADNSQRQPMRLQCIEETPAPGGVLQLAPKQICILVQ